MLKKIEFVDMPLKNQYLQEGKVATKVEPRVKLNEQV